MGLKRDWAAPQGETAQMRLLQCQAGLEMPTRLGASPGPGDLPAHAPTRLTLLAPTHVGGLFMPALFLELTEDAFLGQLALKGLDGLLDIVVHDLDLHAITTLYAEFLV